MYVEGAAWRNDTQAKRCFKYSHRYCLMLASSLHKFKSYKNYMHFVIHHQLDESFYLPIPQSHWIKSFVYSLKKGLFNE